METNKIIKYSTASLYIVLYIIVATISCICSIDFFDLTHNNASSIILAISFEIGSMGCLFGAITTLKNKNNVLIWTMFLFLTFMQMMNNTYYAYSHVDDYNMWVELFDLVELEEITQKRIISIISGCVLPLVSLSFVHLLVDLLKGDDIALNDYTESIDDSEKTNVEKQDKNVDTPRVYEATPLTDNQESMINNERRKSDIEIAKNELQNAVKKLTSYNNRLKHGK